MSQNPESASGATASWATLRRIDLVCGDFERAWKEDGRPRIEDYLNRTEAPDRPHLFRELLLLDVDYRRKAGESPLAKEYAARFPQEMSAIGEALAWNGGAAPRNLRETPVDPEAPLLFSDFELIEHLGEGAMGTVYLALQQSLGKHVAIKLLKRSLLLGDAEISRFLREARLLAELRHPSIVGVHGIGRTPDGNYFLVMDLVDGQNLHRYIDAGEVPIAEAASIVVAIARAVAHAHVKGIVHRDLKPSNVILDKGGRLFLTDFGLAKHFRDDRWNLTLTHEILGTPAYMAPEQAKPSLGAVGPATDVYGLGGILYTLLTCRAPVEGDSTEDTLGNLCSDTPPVSPQDLRPEVPAELASICLRCLEKDPASRYATAEELAGAIEASLGRPIIEEHVVGETVEPRARIVVASGPLRGQEILLPMTGGVAIGRDPECAIQVPDSRVSRRHCIIGRAGPDYAVVDKSVNGTSVNGRKVKSQRLSSGDVLCIGRTYFCFILGKEDSLVGRSLGGYVLEKRIGAGGTGTVYRAFQESLNRHVALKVLCQQLSRQEKYVSRFLREARSAGTLNHPNVVQVHDAGQHEDLYYISMEYMAGGSLQAILDREGSIPLARLLPWMCDAARALAWAERKRIVHRDIKPDNLLIDATGSLKIADFGISLNLEHSKTVLHDGKVLGTPLFVAPEQVLGKVADHRADIYALGSTLYLSASGACPYEGETGYEILHRKTTEAPRPLLEVAPDVPNALSVAVAKMLAPNPEHRYQEAGEVLRVLQDVAAKLGTRPGVRRLPRHAQQGRGEARRRSRPRARPSVPGARLKARLLKVGGLLSLAAVTMVLANAMGLTGPPSPSASQAVVLAPETGNETPPELPNPGVEPPVEPTPNPPEAKPDLVLTKFKVLLENEEYAMAEAELASYSEAAATADGQPAPRKERLEKDLLTRVAEEVKHAGDRARKHSEKEGLEGAANYLDRLRRRLPTKLPPEHIQELDAIVSALDQVRSANERYPQLEEEARIAIQECRFAEATQVLDGFLAGMVSFRCENTIRAGDVKDDAAICKDVLERLKDQLAVMKTFELGTGKAPAGPQCQDCNDSGKVTCSACGGSRRVEATCPICGGSKRKDCSSCTDGKKKCGTCEGKGRARSYDFGSRSFTWVPCTPFLRCGACKGEATVTCAKCDENGVIKVHCDRCGKSGTENCATCSEKATVDVEEILPPLPRAGPYTFQEMACYEVRVLDSAGEPRTLHVGDLDDEVLLRLYMRLSPLEELGADPESRERVGVFLAYAAGLGRAWSLLSLQGSDPARSERRRTRFLSYLHKDAGNTLEWVFRKLEDSRLHSKEEKELLSPLFRLFEAATLLPPDGELRADLVAAYLECRRRDLWTGTPKNLVHAAKVVDKPDGMLEFVYDFKTRDQWKDFHAGDLLPQQTTSPSEKGTASNTRRFLRGDPFRDDIAVEVQLKSQGHWLPFGVAFFTRENDRWTSDAVALRDAGQAELPSVAILTAGLDISLFQTGVFGENNLPAGTSTQSGAVLMAYRNAERGFHALGKPELLSEKQLSRSGDLASANVKMRISPQGFEWRLAQNSLQQSDLQHYFRKPYRSGSVTFLHLGGNRVDQTFAQIKIRGKIDPFWVEDEVSRRALEAIPSAIKSSLPAPGPGRLLEETRRNGQRYRRKMGPVWFIDEFQEKLDALWRSGRGNSKPFSVTERKGGLALRYQKNALIGVGSNLDKALLIGCDKEWGDEFEVTTRLLGAQSWQASQRAGIVLVRGSTDESREFLAGLLWSEGGRLEYALAWKEARSSNPRKLIESAKSEAGPGASWLRLRRRGDLYTFMTSVDGERFSVVAELLWGEGKPTAVGLVAEMSGSEERTEADAIFDFFEVRGPPALGTGRK